MIWTHFSPVPFTLDAERTYDNTTPTHNGKPRGLWLSNEAEYGWREWCESEQFALGTLAHRTDFTITAGDVLHLTTAEAIREFTAEYTVEVGSMHENPDLDAILRSGTLDWGRITERYDGLAITPYQWSVRLDLDHRWYYGWDVASACIWSLGVLEPVREDANRD